MVAGSHFKSCPQFLSIVPEPHVAAVPKAHAEGLVLKDVVVDAEVPHQAGRPVPAEYKSRYLSNSSTFRLLRFFLVKL